MKTKVDIRSAALELLKPHKLVPDELADSIALATADLDIDETRAIALASLREIIERLVHRIAREHGLYDDAALAGLRCAVRRGIRASHYQGQEQ